MPQPDVGPILGVDLRDTRWLVRADPAGQVSIRKAPRFDAARLASDLEYLAAALRRGDVVFVDDAAAARHMRASHAPQGGAPVHTPVTSAPPPEASPRVAS